MSGLTRSGPDGRGPLDGIRVLVLAGAGPVPFASMLLADMGAHVVRVARPVHVPTRELSGTKGLRDEHDLVNRGVDTILVDLKDLGGVEVALRLAAAADVFVEGYRPGVAERLGLGPDVILDCNPAVVYARLTGYGQAGPLAGAAGHDINFVAQSGALHAMARVGEAPRPPINLLGDYAAGGTFAAFGIVCALLEARDSGRGQVVDAAMIDGLAVLTTKLQGLRAAGLFSESPGTNTIDSGAPFYDTYCCADGRYLAVGAVERDFYREFVTGLGVDVARWPDQYDRAQWPRLRELIAAALATRTRAEWADVYEGTDACVTPVWTFEEAAGHPHNLARGVYRCVEGALHPSPAPRLSRTPARPVGAPTSRALDVGWLEGAWGAQRRNR